MGRICDFCFFLKLGHTLKDFRNLKQIDTTEYITKNSKMYHFRYLIKCRKFIYQCIISPKINYYQYLNPLRKFIIQHKQLGFTSFTSNFNQIISNKIITKITTKKQNFHQNLVAFRGSLLSTTYKKCRSEYLLYQKCSLIFQIRYIIKKTFSLIFFK